MNIIITQNNNILKHFTLNRMDIIITVTCEKELFLPLDIVDEPATEPAASHEASLLPQVVLLLLLVHWLQYKKKSLKDL